MRTLALALLLAAAPALAVEHTDGKAAPQSAPPSTNEKPRRPRRPRHAHHRPPQKLRDVAAAGPTRGDWGPQGCPAIK